MSFMNIEEKITTALINGELVSTVEYVQTPIRSHSFNDIVKYNLDNMNASNIWMMIKNEDGNSFTVLYNNANPVVLDTHNVSGFNVGKLVDQILESRDYSMPSDQIARIDFNKNYVLIDTASMEKPSTHFPVVNIPVPVGAGAPIEDISQDIGFYEPPAMGELCGPLDTIDTHTDYSFSNHYFRSEVYDWQMV